MPPRSPTAATVVRVLWFVAFVLVAIAAVASVALLVDYLRPAPVFCAAEGGCGRVKLSSYASFYGLPTPALGVGGMLLLAVLLLLDKPIARSLFAACAAGGALFAGNLIFQQWNMHAFCIYCMTFDGCMIALAFVGVARLPAMPEPPSVLHVPGVTPDSTTVSARLRVSPSAKVRAALGVLLILVAIAPIALSKFLKTHVPAPIEEQLARTPAGQWTLVDFVDFQCPYCRHTQEDFEPILAAEAGHYRIVRKEVPLTHIHEHALGAAHAEVCAESLAKTDEADKMAEVLFTLPEEQMDDAHYKDAAAKIGLDAAAFGKCLDDPATQAKIDADVQMFKDVSGRGLPLLYIGRMRLEGGQDAASLRLAVQQAKDDLAAKP